MTFKTKNKTAWNKHEPEIQARAVVLCWVRWCCRVQYSGWQGRDHTLSLWAWAHEVLSQQCICQQGALKVRALSSPPKGGARRDSPTAGNGVLVTFRWCLCVNECVCVCERERQKDREKVIGYRRVFRNMCLLTF